MKKLIMLLMVVMLIATAGMSYAGEGTDGFSVTIPLETSVTAFYFPTDNTVAGGIAETVLRVKWTDVDYPTMSKFTLDLDANIAKEVNETKETLYGPGIKVNYDVDEIDKSGVTFKPSIGITALRNAKDLNEAADILKNWRVAIYGNIVLYKF
jgi:hypothetical protein